MHMLIRVHRIICNLRAVVILSASSNRVQYIIHTSRFAHLAYCPSMEVLVSKKKLHNIALPGYEDANSIRISSNTCPGVCFVTTF